MSSASTRLLVLGVARFSQPATGYAIMRELVSWQVEDWASVNPGSIYGAIKTLVKDGLLTEEPAGRDAEKTKRDSTRYRLTDEGESRFAGLLRAALWDVTLYNPAPLMAALCFLVELTRDEVTAAIEQRLLRLESALRQLEFDERQMLSDVDTTPPHAAEVVKLTAGRLRGELEFTRGMLGRIAAGAYVFVGEGEQWLPRSDRPGTGLTGTIQA